VLAVVVAVWAFSVPEPRASRLGVAQSLPESSAVMGKVANAEKVVLTTVKQTIDRWSRVLQRVRVLPPLVVSFALLVATLLLWRRSVPIAVRVLDGDRGRTLVPRAPPPRRMAAARV